VVTVSRLLAALAAAAAFVWQRRVATARRAGPISYALARATYAQLRHRSPIVQPPQTQVDALSVAAEATVV
jgi:hypothetical protein